MKVGYFLIVAVALFFSGDAFVLDTTNSALGNIFNITSLPGVINTTGKADPSTPTGACYAQYAQTTYQIGVVGGAKLRFCAQNATKDVEQSPAVSQCAQTELAKITAQLNLASDKLAVCLTMADL